MKEIANLIKLDLICIKKKSLLPLIAGMTVFTLFGFFVGPHYAIPIIVFSGLSVYTMFSIAAKSDFNKLYGMLPIRRSSIVYARFIAGLLLIIVCTVIMALIAYASAEIGYFRNFDDMSEFYDENIASGLTILMTVALIFASSCILTAIEFCMIFIFGVEREIPAAIGIGVVIGLAAFLLNMLDIDVIEKTIKILGKVYGTSEALFYIVMFGIGIVIMPLFAVITNAITKKREL